MPPRRDLHEANRRSWNTATQAHNRHKRAQAQWLARANELLFAEDYELLGPLEGKDVLHLECNSGQDSLCIARRGARVTGVDISDEAIAFARALSRDAGIPASFERADVYDWLPQAAAAGRRFDVAYSSYGWSPWLSDLELWARAVAAVLRPGGRVVLLEFHPFALMFDDDRRLANSYFGASGGAVLEAPEGIEDYVGASGGALAPSGYVELPEPYHNPHPAYEFVWSIADKLSALREAGLALERLEEWDYANGCRLYDDMVPVEDDDGRRWTTAPGQPRMPLMLGICATKPGGLAMYIVDAFTEVQFAGNPAAVCVVEDVLSEATMQAIAAENNLSETAFIRREGEGYAIRWFTPTTEVELCGHATLASAHVVLELLEPAREDVVFHAVNGAALRVCRGRDAGDNRLIMDFPADPPRFVEGAPIAALSLALGFDHDRAPFELLQAGYWLAVFETEAEVRALAPDFAKLAGVPPGELIATAPADDPTLDFVSRFFAPGVGIDEDPVTGSAHCMLAPYWAERLGKPRLAARQISTRGGSLECVVRGDRVELIGSCVGYLSGRMVVPTGPTGSTGPL